MSTMNIKEAQNFLKDYFHVYITSQQTNVFIDNKYSSHKNLSKIYLENSFVHGCLDKDYNNLLDFLEKYEILYVYPSYDDYSVEIFNKDLLTLVGYLMIQGKNNE